MATKAAVTYPRPAPPPGGWALWSLPPLAVVYVVTIDVIGFSTVLFPAAVTARQLLIAGLLAAVCVLQHESTLGVERVLRTTANVVPEDPAAMVPTGVYTMAGALSLPPALFAVVTVVIYGHRWARIARPRMVRGHGPGFRTAFSCSSIVIAGTVTRICGDALGLNLTDGLPEAGSVLTLALLILVYVITQFSLVAIATSLTAQSWNPAYAMLLQTAHHGQLFAQLVVGSLAAFLLVSLTPWLTLLLLPTLWLFSRSVLVETLRTEAASDSATGLLNSAAWHRQATQELVRARRTSRSFGILLIDLDGFRRFNQDYGSRAGDTALTTIARALPTAVRTDDVVARLRGDEFAVIAPAADARDLTTLAQQIQEAVRGAELRPGLRPGEEAPGDQQSPPESWPPAVVVTASVGIASWPDHGSTIDDLMTVANQALARAKKYGAEGIGQPMPPGERR